MSATLSQSGSRLNRDSSPVAPIRSVESKDFPRVPVEFGRAAFHPAQYALTILNVPEERRAPVVQKLARTRDALAAAVANAAPDWSAHVNTVEQLSAVLGVTQSAADVATSISALALQAAPGDADCANMAEVLTRIERAEAKLSLLASVRELAVLADDSGRASAAGDVDAQARLVGAALAAARVPPLAHIESLDVTRNRLCDTAGALHDVLARTVVDIIFSDSGQRAGQPRSQRDGAATSQPRSSSNAPQSNSVISVEALHESACSAARQLLKLRGSGAVADAIENAAVNGNVDALLRATLVSSSLPFASTTVTPSASVFSNIDELGMRGRAGRPLCGFVARDLAWRVRNVMDRIVRLLADVPDVVEGRQSIVSVVWCVVEDRVVSLVHKLLGTGESFVHVGRSCDVGLVPRSSSQLQLSQYSSLSVQLIGMYDDEDGDETARTMIARRDGDGSLADVGTKKIRSNQATAEQRSEHADMEYFTGWMEAYVASLPDVEPSIYNLAAMYEALLSVASYGAVAETAISPVTSVLNHEVAAVKNNKRSSKLLTQLERAGKLLVETVREDVAATVSPVFEQPSAMLLEQENQAVQPHRLQITEEVVRLSALVADVLNLASLVPSASRSLGTALADLVLGPLAARFTCVLDALATHTNAGPVYDRVVVDNPTMTARDVIMRRHKSRPVSLDAVLVLYGSDALAETKLFSEEDWVSVVELIVSVSSLAAEVRRCAGQDVDVGDQPTALRLRFQSRVMRQLSPAGASNVSPRAQASPLQGGSQHDQLKSRSKAAKPMMSAARDAVSAVSRAVNAAEQAMALLEVAVVDRALVLLHADVVTRCYARAYSAMQRCTHRNLIACKSSAHGVRQLLPMREELQSQMRTTEYDEFGDPIVYETDDNKALLSSSSLAERSAIDLQSSRTTLPVEGSPSAARGDVLAMMEKATAAGRMLGEEMLWAEAWTKHNLSSNHHAFICGDAATALATGLAAGGGLSKGQGDASWCDVGDICGSNGAGPTTGAIASAAREFATAAQEQGTSSFATERGSFHNEALLRDVMLCHPTRNVASSSDAIATICD
jgi:hypothetical protein